MRKNCVSRLITYSRDYENHYFIWIHFSLFHLLHSFAQISSKAEILVATLKLPDTNLIDKENLE